MGWWQLAQHWLGLDNASGTAYLAWSGAGGDIGELAIFGAIIAGFRHANCHVRRCLRVGRAPVTGSPWHVCWRHHPEAKPTHHHILAAHRAHLRRLATGRKDGTT
jgi:hypothetical protein